MKLIVQIPCFNEEETLPLTVKDIPRNIKGIDKVEVLEELLDILHLI